VVAFGWVYIPAAAVGLSVVRSGGSVDPVSLYIDHSSLIEPPASAVTPGVHADPGDQDPAVGGVASERRHVSGHRRPSRQSSSNRPDRREALAALAAIMIQIQSAGLGGR